MDCIHSFQLRYILRNSLLDTHNQQTILCHDIVDNRFSCLSSASWSQLLATILLDWFSDHYFPSTLFLMGLGIISNYLCETTITWDRQTRIAYGWHQSRCRSVLSDHTHARIGTISVPLQSPIEDLLYGRIRMLQHTISAWFCAPDGQDRQSDIAISR